MSVISREVHLTARPDGMPTEDQFALRSVAVPDAGPGQVLIENLYMSVDPAMRPPLTNARRVREDFEFGFQPQRGRTYRVLGSANLTDWTTLRTYAATTNAILFRDTNAPPPRRFYRAVTP